MEGTRVAVTVDGERHEGTVVEASYTVKGGEPVVGVALDDPPEGGPGRHVVPLSETEAI
ncbi:hypothetical protein [Halorarius halobius]|uniref:hypothetical protein n=1 Tax=Halorarius halobius TaxID=2962671 RepID=UPI0020CF78D6|nr:hypothetical protein [Halorarius halobius]